MWVENQKRLTLGRYLVSLVIVIPLFMLMVFLKKKIEINKVYIVDNIVYQY